MIRKWTYLILAVLCLGILFLYLQLDSLTEDTVAPVIRIREAPLEIYIADPDEILFEGITARDETDGDVTGSMLVESITLSGEDGHATVVYAAFDKAGNVTKARREIRYKDYYSPRFDLKQPLILQENSGVDILSLITATDCMDGDITHWVRATALDGDNLNTVGKHRIQIRVSNSMGDTSVLELPVDVIPSGQSQGTLKLRDYVVYLDVGDPFDEMDYPLSYTLGNKTTEFNHRLPENFQLATEGRVDPWTPGLYEVIYTLVYTENGYTYTGFSKLFVVVEG